MRRFAVPVVSVLVALGLVALLIFGVLQTSSSDTSIEEALARGERPVAHDATLPLLGGGSRSLADFRGTVVVVNFFAHWCPPCKREAPLIARTQKTIASRGATFLGVAWDDTTDKVQEFVDEHGIDYPVVSDVDASFGNAYGVGALPETFVVDRDGRIVAALRGELDEQWIAEHVEPLLTPGS
jgi:cytochrome c biogenesis protein CcmG/thiol:disulfide interchange protein DsbE